MANNVNFKEMRFVIRNLIDVDDVSPTTAPEIPFDVASTTSEFPPKRKGWCSTAAVGISLSYETKVSIQ